MKNIIHPSDIENGKIFPISIINLLKDFKIKNNLKMYQQYVSSLMTSNNKFRNMLIYHDLGTGKTITGITIVNSFLLTQEYIVIILLPASLKDSNWVKAIEKWINHKKINTKKNIFFISFNSPNFYQKLIEIKNLIDSNVSIIYLIDEAHNFFHNVYSNISKNEGSKNALQVYNNLKNDLEQNESNKLILLSATPILSEPFEVALMYNLLRPNTFPVQKSEFEELFLNNKNKNIFVTRILGLTSYYKNNDKQNFPELSEKVVKVAMSKYQYKVYSYFHEKERKNKSSYKIYTRSSSNFVFPIIEESQINPYKRPRPNMFTDQKQYSAEIKKYLIEMKKYLKKNISKNDIVNNFQDCIKNYSSNIIFYIFTSKNTSNSLKLLYNYSSKMTCILFSLFVNEGKSIIYSSFTSLEGIEIMSLYLDCMQIKYLYYSGKLTLQERSNNISIFNHKNNILGQKYKVFLLSSAGIEGISLTNVRTVNILEPAWNQGVIKQLIGRAVRLNSHQELSSKNRNVIVYHYISTIKKDIKLTDEIIYENSLENEKTKKYFLNLMQMSAFDCELLNNDGCFHFEQDVYKKHFENINVGPAYQKDIILKNNNLKKKKINLYYCKVFMDNNNKSMYQYIDFNTGLIYDKEYNNIPIGILQRDDKHLFIIKKINDEFIFFSKNI